MSAPTFTPSQQAVIAHGQGPALVFAGAGSGKTTTMVHRIARLVKEGVPPQQILATSFNRAAVDEIAHNLQGLGVRGVETRTLHSLGYSVLAAATKRGGFALDLGKARIGVADLDRYLLNRVMVQAKKQRLSLADDLNRLDTDDFLAFLGQCKGNLAYADLASQRLSGTLAGKSAASQAVAPAQFPWYLDLYRLYEETRHKLGWLTFDDLLMSSWERLVTQPPLLSHIQNRYRYMLVDEFQDVNLAQAEIVHLLARPHGNLMVIGDDDQTIYEWRGAAPRFILGFQRRYQAATYLLQENFRCRPAQIELANQIIRHNRERAEKTLIATRPPGGSTALALHTDRTTQAQTIVQQIQQALSQGTSPDAMAVLVRLYAQTPPIEAALLRADIPYTVVGETPFAQRPEAAVLFHYLSVGKLEGKLLAGQRLKMDEADLLNESWRQIVNRPMRYIARRFWDQALQQAIQQGTPISQSLARLAEEAPQGVDRRMITLGNDLEWLTAGMKRTTDAHTLLTTLEARLGYGEALAKEGGGEALVQARRDGLTTFLAMAQKGETWQAFRRRCEQIGPSSGNRPSVTITTIFRAKGLEWPLVFVPDCNQGMIPYLRESREESGGESGGESREESDGHDVDLAEERRLLYVAVTRSREHLSLHALENRPLSLFLQQAGIKPTQSARHATKKPETRQTRTRKRPTPQSPLPNAQPQPFSRTRQNTQEILDGIRGVAELIGRLWRR